MPEIPLLDSHSFESTHFSSRKYRELTQQVPQTFLLPLARGILSMHWGLSSAVREAVPGHPINNNPPTHHPQDSLCTLTLHGARNQLKLRLSLFSRPSLLSEVSRAEQEGRCKLYKALWVILRIRPRGLDCLMLVVLFLSVLETAEARGQAGDATDLRSSTAGVSSSWKLANVVPTSTD